MLPGGREQVRRPGAPAADPRAQTGSRGAVDPPRQPAAVRARRRGRPSAGTDPASAVAAAGEARCVQDPRRVAGLLATEGLQPIEGKLENIDVLYDAGFRIAGLTHFFDNEVGGSAHGLNKGGLTPLGRQVIARLEEKAMLVDLAHASLPLIDDVLAMATRPVLVSHTGVEGTCPGTRNLSDKHIQAIAAKGGVIGIGYWSTAVCDTSVAAIVSQPAEGSSGQSRRSVQIGPSLLTNLGLMTLPCPPSHAQSARYFPSPSTAKTGLIPCALHSAKSSSPWSGDI